MWPAATLFKLKRVLFPSTFLQIKSNESRLFQATMAHGTQTHDPTQGHKHTTQHMDTNTRPNRDTNTRPNTRTQTHDPTQGHKHTTQHRDKRSLCRLQPLKLSVHLVTILHLPIINLFVVHFWAGVYSCFCRRVTRDKLSVPAHDVAIWLESSKYNGLTYSSCYVSWT